MIIKQIRVFNDSVCIFSVSPYIKLNIYTRSFLRGSVTERLLAVCAHVCPYCASHGFTLIRRARLPA